MYEPMSRSGVKVRVAENRTGSRDTVGIKPVDAPFGAPLSIDNVLIQKLLCRFFWRGGYLGGSILNPLEDGGDALAATDAQGGEGVAAADAVKLVDGLCGDDGAGGKGQRQVGRGARRSLSSVLGGTRGFSGRPVRYDPALKQHQNQRGVARCV